MPKKNRRLTAEELLAARALHKRIRARLVQLSGSDQELMWALRRKVYKELIYDGGKPMARRALKFTKRFQQGGRCALSERRLPKAYCVLDRLVAMKGPHDQEHAAPVPVL
jgi:hypothetical protein